MGRGRSGDVAATKGHRTLTWPGLSRRGSRCVTDAPRRMAQQGGDDLTGCNNAASITTSTGTSTREPPRTDVTFCRSSQRERVESKCVYDKCLFSRRVTSILPLHRDKKIDVTLI